MGRRGGCSHSARCTPIRCSRWCRPHAAPVAPYAVSMQPPRCPHAASLPARCLHAAPTSPSCRPRATPAPPPRRPHAAPTGPHVVPSPPRPWPPAVPVLPLCRPYAASTPPPRRLHAAARQRSTSRHPNAALNFAPTPLHATSTPTSRCRDAALTPQHAASPLPLYRNTVLDTVAARRRSTPPPYRGGRGGGWGWNGEKRGRMWSKW